MTTKNNAEIAQNKQVDLIKNIALLSKEYMNQASKQRDKIEEEDDDDTLKEILNYFINAVFIVTTLINKLKNPKDQKTNIELLNYIKSQDDIKLLGYLSLPDPLKLLDTLSSRDNAELVDNFKETIEKIDQLVRDKYLPTRLAKIYEAIKTLLRDLIALFVPFEGRHAINEATQTLTSARSTLFSEIKTLEKSLNPPEKTLNPPEETEQFHYYRSMIAPMFG